MKPFTTEEWEQLKAMTPKDSHPTIRRLIVEVDRLRDALVEIDQCGFDKTGPCANHAHKVARETLRP